MVTESIATWFLNSVAGLVGILPEPSQQMRDAAGSFEGRIDQIVESIANLNPIIPFDGIAAAAGIMLAFIGIATVLQVSRIVISVFTLGGGSV